MVALRYWVMSVSRAATYDTDHHQQETRFPWEAAFH